MADQSSPVPPQRQPALAPTSDRRDAVVSKLTQYFAAGRIEMDDFESRTDRALRAATNDDLDAVLTELSPAARKDVATATNPGEFAVDQPRRHGSRMTFVVMGGVDRKGRWMPARRHLVFVWMGGLELDFREAILPPGVTDVYVFAMWGGVEVAVPQGLDVDVSGGAVIGGLERITQESGSTDPRRPRLRIHALALMGSIEVRALALGDKWDKEDGEED